MWYCVYIFVSVYINNLAVQLYFKFESAKCVPVPELVYIQTKLFLVCIFLYLSSFVSVDVSFVFVLIVCKYVCLEFFYSLIYMYLLECSCLSLLVY